MKIAVLCSSGRTAQDVGRFCASALRGLGHEVALRSDIPARGARLTPAPLRRFLPAFHHALLKRWLRRQRPELVLVIKGDDLDPQRIASLRAAAPVRWVNWWLDDPGSLFLSRTLSPAYDLFLTNDPPSVEEHRDLGAASVDWLTFAHDPGTHRKANLTDGDRDRFAADVVFAGRLTSRRVEMLTPLVDKGLALWAEPTIVDLDPDGTITRRPLPEDHPLWKARRGDSVWGEDLSALYGAATVCVNVHAHGEYDSNMRAFEVTACGGFLITEDRPLVHELFRVADPDREVVVYDGAEDLARKVDHYLRHDDEREAIAARGHARCLRDHSYATRMSQLLERLP